jgi:hypothetical protein
MAEAAGLAMGLRDLSRPDLFYFYHFSRTAILTGLKLPEGSRAVVAPAFAVMKDNK